MRVVTSVVVVAVLLMTGTAFAQVPSEFADARLRPGRKVAITDEQGEKITGPFRSLDADRISIGQDGKVRDVRLGQVLRIEAVDDLKNGLLIGLGIGAGLFVVEAIAAGSDGITLNAAGYAVVGSIYAGLGAGIGAGIDALVGGNKTIYRRGSTPRVTVGPTLRPRRAGVDVAFSW
jgi:hypothetical protein